MTCNLTLIDRDGNSQVLRGVADDKAKETRAMMRVVAEKMNWKKPFIITTRKLP